MAANRRIGKRAAMTGMGRVPPEAAALLERHLSGWRCPRITSLLALLDSDGKSLN